MGAIDGEHRPWRDLHTSQLRRLREITRIPARNLRPEEQSAAGHLPSPIGRVLPQALRQLIPPLAEFATPQVSRVFDMRNEPYRDQLTHQGRPKVCDSLQP